MRRDVLRQPLGQWPQFAAQFCGELGGLGVFREFRFVLLRLGGHAQRSSRFRLPLRALLLVRRTVVLATAGALVVPPGAFRSTAVEALLVAAPIGASVAAVPPLALTRVTTSRVATLTTAAVAALVVAVPPLTVVEAAFTVLRFVAGEAAAAPVTPVFAFPVSAAALGSSVVVVAAAASPSTTSGAVSAGTGPTASPAAPVIGTGHRTS
ncbi:hypothetical protein [Saccharopolyspora rosea]|uniref:hypothetical protein n=1 Tax=Saccharopolyspora rosea TaxID=524884 RepID=UPI0021DB634D|nr:hypothetical protein [Saccharopolyspora rosea]